MNRALGILIVSSAAALISSPAHAAVVFSILPSTVSVGPGGAGDFDVVLTNTGTGNITVAAFAFEVSVTDTDINLTGADFSTVADPYIFAGDSFDQANSLTLNYTSGETLDASDSYGTSGSGVTLTSGESLALGNVQFSVVDGAALGLFALSFTGSPTVADGNNLSGPAPAATAINVDTFSGGNIDITPEPSSLLMMLGGTGAMAWAGRRRLSTSRYRRCA